LSELLRRKIKSVRPNFEYLDSEITLIKTGNSKKGRVLTSDLFADSVLDLDAFLQAESKGRWTLIVRIGAQPTLVRTVGESNKELFETVAKAKGKTFLKGTRAMEEMTEFHAGYNACNTTAELKSYLRNLGAKKIKINDQFTILLCRFLKKNELGYWPADITMKEQCTQAMNHIRCWLLKVRKDINSVCTDSLESINGNDVLKGLEDIVVTNVNDIGLKQKQASSPELQLYLQNQEGQQDQYPFSCSCYR